MNTDALNDVKKIVGEKNFTDELIDMVSFSYDASDHVHRPRAAVWPQSAEQISAILELANQRGFSVTPRGAGTGMAGGCVPVEGGLVLDLCRMDAIREVNYSDRLVVVEPGVIYAILQNELGKGGFCFPPDPASGKACTLGGNVATNAGGIRGAKYGVTKDYVLGLEVVLPSGEIARLGGRTMKTSSGLDLTRLMVGSEGVLGVVTEVTLKVNPKPIAFRTSQASFDDLEKAGRAVMEIMHSGVIPSVLEIMDENTVRVLREKGGMNLPNTKALLLAETDGYTDGEAAYQMEKLVEIFNLEGAAKVETADTPEESAALWKARKSAGSTAAQLRPHNISEDIAIPMSQLPEFLRAFSAAMPKYNLPFVVFGHAGDGNLHPKVMYDRSDPEQTKNVHKAADELFQLACDLGGTITGEHGVGLAKAPYMALEHDPASMKLMRSVKKLLDPNNILNPGKMDLG